MRTTSDSTLAGVKADYAREGQLSPPGQRHGLHRFVRSLQPANMGIVSKALALGLLAFIAGCNPVEKNTQASLDKAKAESAGQLNQVPFSEFTVKLQIQDTRFEVSGGFKLGSASNGIDFFNEPVNLSIGDLSIAIPAGSFKLDEKGKPKYEVVADGLAWTVVIREQSAGKFRLKAEAEGAKQFSQSQLENVTLTVGNDSGSAKAELN